MQPPLLEQIKVVEMRKCTEDILDDVHQIVDFEWL